MDPLRESAEAAGTAVFDPSGSGGAHCVTNALHESPDRAQSWHGERASKSEETDLTSLLQSMEMLGMEASTGSEMTEQQQEEEEGEHGSEYDEGLEKLSTMDKQDLFNEMFPTIKAFDISYTLKKNGDNFGRTVEDLLNQVFFKEVQEIYGDGEIATKGIDAFIDGANGTTKGRKGKAKRKTQAKLLRRTSSTPALLGDKSTNSPSSPFPGLSKWDLGKKDVEFITQRTYLSPQAVSSQYHISGASLPKTIVAILASNPIENPHIGDPTDPVLDDHAAELGRDFPTLSSSHLHSLIHLTYPSTTSAHELAIAVTTTPTAPINHHGGIQLIPLYQRPHLSSSSDPSAPSQQTSAPSIPLSHPTALALASTYMTARSTAFAQASAAYRKSRSSPLIGAAAGYYSQIGRDAATSVQKYNAAAADALVEAQSSASELDLHGVGVKDAVRIAKMKVEGWWEGSGRADWRKAARGPGAEGYRVVTGVGRHSESGRARLGPAVGGMLVREGWKVEVGTGVLVVTGRARKGRFS